MTTSYPTLAYPQQSVLEQEASSRESFWVRSFVIFQFACQLALLIEYFSPLRVFVRAAAFGSSLLLLALLPKGRGRSHPAIHSASWVLVILFLSLLHPTTNSWISGIAQIALYLAILGPLFWVARLQIDAAALRKILLILFIFYSLSAATGILQVYFPGQFQPNLSKVYADMDRGYVEDLKITLANGQRVFRPMGLTDNPGGAASAGFYAMLLGVGFYLTSRRREAQYACLFSITLGLSCIYLTQVRSWLVIAALCLVVFFSLLAWQKRTASLIRLATVMGVVIVLSFAFAVTLGGKSLTDRMFTLVADKPGTVYYKNRGIFLEETINVLLPQYPLGAGLGRWGMMNNYFGDNSDPERGNIYVEIQWTGWLLDGGVPLILVYVSAIFITMRTALKIALNRNASDLSIWAAIILAYCIGALATTFSYPLFIGQSGMEFWVLNTALFAASRTRNSAPGFNLDARR